MIPYPYYIHTISILYPYHTHILPIPYRYPIPTTSTASITQPVSGREILPEHRSQIRERRRWSPPGGGLLNGLAKSKNHRPIKYNKHCASRFRLWCGRLGSSPPTRRAGVHQREMGFAPIRSGLQETGKGERAGKGKGLKGRAGLPVIPSFSLVQLLASGFNRGFSG